MATSIELRGEKIAGWVTKKTGIKVDGDRFVVAQIEDNPGIYVTEFGIVDLKFGTVTNGGGDQSPAVILGCKKISLLQSRQRRDERIINIFSDRVTPGVGTGCQQLTDGVDLFIHTDYFDL
ncbi:hypothetical protein HYT74_01575 [Candidatus Daviesbacteria bacterium]|nr:hypothetical protein [Candidatus Daviesbacteria bacterium]